MFLNRDRATAIMGESGLAGLVATSPENVTYAADYTNWTIHTFKDMEVYAVVPSRGEVALVIPIDGLEYIAERPSAAARIYTYGTYHIRRRDGAELTPMEARVAELRDRVDTHRPTASESLRQALEDASLVGERLGVDEGGVTQSGWDDIAQLVGPGLTAARETWRRIRRIKTPSEVEALRYSALAVEAGIQAAFASARPGMTETDLERTIRMVTVSRGVIPGHCETSAGTRGACCTAPSPDYRLKLGDVIRSDCGGRYRWYHADTGRTAVLGTPPHDLEVYFRALRAGIDAMLGAIAPGCRVVDLFNLAVNTVRDAGIPHYQRHHVGHGIGLEMYEAPLLVGAEGSRDIHRSADPPTALEEGMVINIELPYYELGLGGLQIEDTLVVRATGPELLTMASRDMYRS